MEKNSEIACDKSRKLEEDINIAKPLLIWNNNENKNQKISNNSNDSLLWKKRRNQK